MAPDRQAGSPGEVRAAPTWRRSHGTDALMIRAEEASEGGSFERDLRTGEADYSPGVGRLYGLGPEAELTPELLRKHVHPNDRGLVEQAIERAIKDKEAFTFEIRVTRADGMERLLRSRGRVVFEDDQPSKLVGTIQDVTDEVTAGPSRELLSRVVQSSDDAIITQTRDGTITSWNGGARRLYRYSAEEAIGNPISIIEPPDLAGEHEEILRRVFSGESLDHFETEHVRKDGRRIVVALTVSPVRDAEGRIISAAVLGRDVTERRHYEERLRHLADHDQLTGLFNRRRFAEELKREFARAGRYHTAGAVIGIDLDNFKVVNDSAGHAAGDVVLVAVAHAMRRRFRETDVIARMGGDEFAVLLDDVELDHARQAAEDLLGALRSTRPVFGGKSWQISASVGVATFQPDEATAREVEIFADLAMYEAKRAGGDRVVVYSPEEGRRARSLARQPWSDRIRDALEYDRFVLYLQPILDLVTGLISHGELLLRMRDNHNKLIPPGTFLPTAERAGLIHEIDRWVVRKAIELLADSARVPAGGALAVNLSGASVTGDQRLLEVIESELARTGVNPERLIFEVTETTAIANMPEAASFARDLTRLGCNLALDDFGTGFSSFYYLKHLPVRYIKLDGEFIQNLPRSKVDEHVVRAIVEVARSLNIKTVAESVADEATIRLLRKHRVDYAQGFHIGKPGRVSARRIRGDSNAKPSGGRSTPIRLVQR
jgi:diguanylate cyclase (GGDEF)-like protein/PAS domain S-box-containing protein